MSIKNAKPGDLFKFNYQSSYQTTFWVVPEHNVTYKKLHLKNANALYERGHKNVDAGSLHNHIVEFISEFDSIIYFPTLKLYSAHLKSRLIPLT